MMFFDADFLVDTVDATTVRFTDKAQVESQTHASSTERFATSDGTQLVLDRVLPDGDIKHVVVALHSFGDYKAAFAHVAPVWAQQGIATYAPDLRGFGQSGAHGEWAGTEKLVTDVLELVALIRSIHSDIPISFVGESMGAGVALIAASRLPKGYVSKLILAGPAVREGLPFRWAFDAVLEIGEALIPGASKTVSRDKNPLLSEKAESRLAGDPLVVREVSVEMYEGVVDLADAASKATETVDVPTLLLFGTEDETIHPKAIKAAAKSLRQSQLCAMRGAPHLIFQWEQSLPVIAASSSWLLSDTSKDLGLNCLPAVPDGT